MERRYIFISGIYASVSYAQNIRDIIQLRNATRMRALAYTARVRILVAF